VVENEEWACRLQRRREVGVVGAAVGAQVELLREMCLPRDRLEGGLLPGPAEVSGVAGGLDDVGW
jgi:hypothetical protein